jgi:photosystem II stability/assembly factor-like uncharacterized protein
MEPTENQETLYALAAVDNGAGGHTLYAARSSGLHYSPDGGKTWTYAYRSFLGEQPLPTSCVALSPNFKSDGLLLAGAAGAVLVSHDRGMTWEVLHFELPPPVVSAAAFSPDFERDGAAFLATLEDGVFCTYDHCNSWMNWNFGLLDANGQCIAVSPDYAGDRLLFVGTSSGLFRSANGGRSWEGVHLPGGFASVNSLAFSPDYMNDNSLFLGTESNGLYHSTDGGMTWEQAGEGLGDGAVYALLLAPDYAASGKIAALVEQGLMLSTDRGLHFRLWLEGEISAFCAPRGLEAGMKMCVGAGDQIKEIVI